VSQWIRQWTAIILSRWSKFCCGWYVCESMVVSWVISHQNCLITQVRL